MSQTATVTPGALWTGRGLSTLIVLFMIFDGVIKLPPLDVVTQTMVQLGWPADPNVSRMLGIIGLVSTALYAVPRTQVLGAILLTAYLGGAIATHIRIGSPLFRTHCSASISASSCGRPFPAQPPGARADPAQPIEPTSKKPSDGGRVAGEDHVCRHPSSFDFGSNRPFAS